MREGWNGMSEPVAAIHAMTAHLACAFVSHGINTGGPASSDSLVL